MSKIAMTPNASGTGTFSIASPATNTNRTLMLPDASGTLNLSGAPNEVPAGSTAAPAIYPTGDTNTGIFFPAADTIAFAEGGAEVMRIDSSGNVGIGTSSPEAKLHVAQTASAAGIRVEVGSGSYSGNVALFGVSGQSNGYYITKDTVNNIQHIWDGTGGAERMRLDSSGNLLVGKTAANNTALGFFVNIAGGISGVTSGDSWYCNKATGYTDSVFIRFQINATSVGFISTNGTSTTYSTTSDYRLKNTVVPITGALAKVALLKPVTYKWNIDGSDGQGFIAHELQEVAPECVTGEKDAVDEEGKPVYQGIDTSFLVATLTAAIQELKAIVDAQGVEIANLKGQK